MIDDNSQATSLNDLNEFNQYLQKKKKSITATAQADVYMNLIRNPDGEFKYAMSYEDPQDKVNQPMSHLQVMKAASQFQNMEIAENAL